MFALLELRMSITVIKQIYGDDAVRKLSVYLQPFRRTAAYSMPSNNYQQPLVTENLQHIL